jgi:M6 family metalloprotease-like protein
MRNRWGSITVPILLVATLFSSISAANGSALPTEQCKLPKSYQQTLSPGFPRDSALIPSLGTIRSIFIYVDFPDNKSQQNNKSFTNQYVVGAKKFLEAQSYGRAKFLFDSTEKTFRINRNSSTYKLLKDGQGDAGRLVQDAIDAADTEFDFTPYDFVTVVPPKDTKTILNSGALTGGKGNFKSNERDFSSAVWIGKAKLSNFNQPGFGWSFYAHELGHLLGLMHPYYQRDGGPGAVWDLMGNGGTSVPEMIGWHRFLLGWLNDKEVSCLSKDTLTQQQILLSPLNTKSAGTKVVMIPLSNKKSLMIEARRASTFDKLQKFEEGTLVYLVDVTKGDDQGIISILGKKGTKREGQTLESLSKGEKLSYERITVQVISSSKQGDTVRISKSS